MAVAKKKSPGPWEGTGAVRASTLGAEKNINRG